VHAGRSWSDRFSSFVAKKTNAAATARPSPFVTTLERHLEQLLPVVTPWSRTAFGGPFYVRHPGPRMPSCSLVFVRSADGNTGADDPAALGGGATDFHVVYEGLSRVLADGVLVGARTVHSGSQVFSVWHPEMVELRRAAGLPRHPTQIVATQRGLDLRRGLIFNAPDVPVILLSQPEGVRAMTPELAPRPWIRAIVLADPAELAPAFEELRAAGIRRISCIGGRTLAAGLLARQLVDDTYLTTSARPGGEAGTPLPTDAVNGELIVEKRGTADDRGVLFQQFDLRTRRNRHG
jgi:riboflavin biosynthesis pyrimidine reductase